MIKQKNYYCRSRNRLYRRSYQTIIFFKEKLKSMELKRVVVTGFGAITPIGNNAQEYWKT